MLKKQVSPKIVAIVFAVLVICFIVAVYVSAWTEPSAVPPGTNVPLPLNISNTQQIKTGALRLGGLTVDNDTYLATVAGNVGIGTTGPGTGFGSAAWGTLGGGLGNYFSTHLYGNKDGGALLLEGNDSVHLMFGDRNGATNQKVSRILSQQGKLVFQGLNDALDVNGQPVIARDNILVVDYVAGNVGIGTPGPGYKLDIAGALRLQPGAAPTAANGVMYYDSTTNKFRCYQNGAWLDCIGAGGSGVTSLSAGSGITLTPDPITAIGTIAANTNVVQARVTGTCAAGSSIRVIGSNGAVTCESDTVGAIGLTSATFSIPIGQSGTQVCVAWGGVCVEATGDDCGYVRVATVGSVTCIKLTF